MARLSQTNPELFTNPTLGEANPTTFLDEEVAQSVEDKQARRDKREPLIARREIRYPVWAPAVPVPSSVADVVNLHDPDNDEVVVEGVGKVPTTVTANGNPPVADYTVPAESFSSSVKPDDDSDVNTDYKTEFDFSGE